MPDYDYDDLVASARAEVISNSKRKVKFFGLLFLANLVVLMSPLKGMPGHALWPYFGWISCYALPCAGALVYSRAFNLIVERVKRGKPSR